ncbi:MAG TPA: hypothetical protein VFD83_05050, partial [Candidatus Polarisedimenticolia bacterium]|nr:hypothetical protein [Candidatus Polarisedimenticolia bacterium]
MTDRERIQLAAEAREHVLRTIRGPGDIAAAVMETTSNLLTRTLKHAHVTGSELRRLVVDTLTETIHGVAQAENDLDEAAEAIMLGV